MFLEREEGKEKNIDAREKRRLVASRMYPDWGSNLEPRYVPQWGIDTTTFQLWDGVLTNRATQARVSLYFYLWENVYDFPSPRSNLSNRNLT